MNNTLKTAAFAATAATALVSGAAQADERKFDVAAFDSVHIATGINAEITLGEPQTVRAEARSNILDKLKVEVSDSELSVSVDQSFLDFILNGGILGGLLFGENKTTVYITVPELTAVAASSGADVRADRIEADGFEVNASSGADINLTGFVGANVETRVSSGADIRMDGTCGALDVRASSGANAHLRDLECQVVEADASSGSDIDVTALEEINAQANSGANINIYGNPARTNVESSSGGDIHTR
jgi:hypothetical protein